MLSLILPPEGHIFRTLAIYLVTIGTLNVVLMTLLVVNQMIFYVWLANRVKEAKARDEVEKSRGIRTEKLLTLVEGWANRTLEESQKMSERAAEVKDKMEETKTAAEKTVTTAEELKQTVKEVPDKVVEKMKNNDAIQFR
jgi:thiol:disulfide interchange protein